MLIVPTILQNACLSPSPDSQSYLAIMHLIPHDTRLGPCHGPMFGSGRVNDPTSRWVTVFLWPLIRPRSVLWIVSGSV